jgi:hypothetical protein
MEQERLDGGGLAVQDFFHQIVQHKPVAAGERLNEVGGVRLALHREGGQL